MLTVLLGLPECSSASHRTGILNRGHLAFVDATQFNSLPRRPLDVPPQVFQHRCIGLSSNFPSLGFSLCNLNRLSGLSA